MRFIKIQQGSVNLKMIFSVVAITTVVMFFWLPESTDHKAALTNDTGAVINLQSDTKHEIEIISKEEVDVSELSDSRLYDELWSKIHDPELRGTLTARDILDSPGFNKLPAEQMQRLVNEIMQLIKSNEIDSTAFMKDISRNEGTLSAALVKGAEEVPSGQLKTDEIQAEATPQQAQDMERVRQLLHDPESLKTVTAAQLLNMPEVQKLPVHLRNKLAEEAIGMLSRGELDSETFLAQPSAVKPDDEAARAAVTHEQWQEFQGFQSRLQAPDFQENTTLAEILTSPEYKKLPAYLRNQLSSEAVKIIETNKAY